MFIPASDPCPADNILKLIDVDHEGVTSDGERFDAECNAYRGHASVEDVFIRYPCGTLKLVQRVMPARQAV